MVGLLLLTGWIASTSLKAAPSVAFPDTLPPHPWYAPRHVLLQAAGGQGLVAVGAGYTMARRRLELDALLGYVPQKYSRTAMGIGTIKITYSPWIIPLAHHRWGLRPFAVGAFVSYTASKGLNSSRDGKYEKGYYWWSSHTRVGPFVGGQIQYERPRSTHRDARTISLYYELGTNELYLASWWANRGELTLREILTLGMGVKFHW